MKKNLFIAVFLFLISSTACLASGFTGFISEEMPAYHQSDSESICCDPELIVCDQEDVALQVKKGKILNVFKIVHSPIINEGNVVLKNLFQSVNVSENKKLLIDKSRIIKTVIRLE